ncbi:unnamed protein product [Bursaphelenchus okinawaensis]|uniref:Uncharacterized protein n=1 Tax=Bursaphelenchus okinawaensis TaxID=465554 RepID=A0A811KYP2_9BILA|nr:unnamed protein product [Bursaphelenchus okinawaensis]CAG9114390.1 unnamed protein product [Bursaphelenchus okinawaensis]
MIKLVTALLVVVAHASALDYDQNGGKVSLTIGEAAKIDLKFQLSVRTSSLIVFGPECKDVGSCTRNGHPFYDAAKDKHTLTDGKDQLDIYKTKTATNVTVNIGDKTVLHDVSVIFAPVEEKTKNDTYLYDALLGLETGSGSAFDKLVSSYDNKHLLIVPKDQDDKDSKPQALLGSEPKKACGEFTLVDSTTNF